MSKTITVVGAVFSSSEAVLAFRRNADRSAGGQWEFPGGKVEPNETPEEALRREILEELGLDVTVGPLIDRSSTVVGENTIDLACYHVSTDQYPTESSDHDKIVWQPLNKIDQLDWAKPDLPTIEKLLKARK
ncbi:(deoxy)nucleoside triphosphate pyrophosphohydrolase [Dietzia sp. NCCP-2495]|uniref:(deoxy)nucleoside triphosphate pyrophosphohydrolase n=1 Tax=Dietzia sp. NCCP-2495 TaxID=2934675 RepID=UPI00222FCC73|nr:(deoxy)nucleoside triphosphate pyrophosphohydrolase [Dietzia sp. NCCP-2495]GLB64144.1 (deoxy)nucleoside triphosphate pyrophosphohydrolase [Dietzia sp. NCCP-2495]